MLWWAAWECLCLGTPCHSLGADCATPPTPHCSPPDSLMFFIHCLTVGGLTPSREDLLAGFKMDPGWLFLVVCISVPVKPGRCRPIPAVCPLSLLCATQISLQCTVSPKCGDHPHTLSVAQGQPLPRFKVTESTSFPLHGSVGRDSQHLNKSLQSNHFTNSPFLHSL